MNLPRKIVALHRSLATAVIPHAFGGALALAWCTRRARGTVDIDMNLFVSPERAHDVLAALPPDVAWEESDVGRIERDGQDRIWWDDTPVDLFFATTEFHWGANARIRWEPFADDELPFLSCRDLAVFKAFFARTRDWADLEEMAAAGTLDLEAALGVLVRYLGPDDERIGRLRALA